MSKAKKITYWVFTVWMSLGMVSTAIPQVLILKAEADYITKLGYPTYALQMIGMCKILGVVAVLIPKFTRVKEWAYAGFFFVMAGAIYSHIAHGDGMNDIFPSMLLFTLVVISYLTRPASRRLVALNQ